MLPDETGKPFGMLTMVKSFVIFDQMLVALTIRTRESIDTKRSTTIGRMPLALGYINTRQIERALQEGLDPRFGDMRIAKGFITLEQISEAMTV